MKITALVSAFAVTAFLTGGAALALDAAPAKPAAAAKTDTAAAPKTTAAPRSAKSIECSKEADAKGLHGKERKKFREECKRGQ